LPVGLGVVLVAVVLPCGNFVGEEFFVGDAAIQTLRREDAEFGFGHVEPTTVLGRVVPFEALDEPARRGQTGSARDARRPAAINAVDLALV